MKNPHNALLKKFSVGKKRDQELFKSFIVFRGLKKLLRLNAKYPYPPPNPSYGGISK